MRPGFTLLELLIALTIMGMITVMLAASTRFGISAWHRSDALEATAGELSLARATLARDLTLAYPEWNPSDRTAPVVVFDGTERQMRFLAPAPQAMAAAGFALFTLSGETTETGQRLTLAADFETAEQTGDRRSTVLDRAAEIAFAYYGADDPQSAPTWQPTWQGKRSLPLLIRVHVGFPENDDRRWPDLVIAPHIAVDAMCVYDPLTFHCRGR